MLNGRATLDDKIVLKGAGVVQTMGSSCKEATEAVRAPLAKAHKHGIAGTQREATAAKETEEMERGSEEQGPPRSRVSGKVSKASRAIIAASRKK